MHWRSITATSHQTHRSSTGLAHLLCLILHNSQYRNINKTMATTPATSSTMNTDSQALALSVVAELAAATATPAVTAFSEPITYAAADNDGKIQRFVQKLWKIVNSKSALVGWSADGLRVVIPRPKDFAKQVLPRYFNTSNLSSFTRQLHFYGFKKTLTAKRTRAENWECHHEHFVREHPEWLMRITRKRCNMQMASQEETSLLRKELQDLRETVARQQKQMENMAALLLALHSSHGSDRKRKASACIERPKQEPRIEQLDPVSGEHCIFETSQNENYRSCNNFEDVFRLLPDDDDLGEIDDDDFNYWS